MNIQMTGIDHKKAPLKVREMFTFTSRENLELMQSVMENDNFDGCVLLTTCNRTELWVSFRDGKKADLLPLLCSFKGLCADEYRSYFYDYDGYEAVEYLFEMTSGLKSMIIGEDQILAQVKKAHENARSSNMCTGVLDVLFRSAVTGAKKVKTELAISTAKASAVDYALARLEQGGMDFKNKRCLVIGNGEMGKRAAGALIAGGADVTVTIRQYKSGIVEVIPGCKRINYSQRYEMIPSCDMVVSATSSPNITLSCKEIMDCGLKGDTVFIDLAVPRDIEPGVGELDGATLYNIDNFAVSETEELKYELSAARKLLNEQKEKFINWYECRDLLPAMEQLGTYFGSEVAGRLNGTVKSLGLDNEQKETLQSALRSASEKVIKKLIFAVRDEAGIDVFRKCIEAMEGVESNA